MLDRGDAEQAARILEEAVAARPGSSHLHHLLGIAYRRLNRWDEAEIELLRGRDSAPMWPDPWGLEPTSRRVEFYTRLDDAKFAYDRGRMDLAVPAMEDLLASKPDDRRALSALGRAYLSVGRTEDGFRLLRRMHDLYPDHHEVHLNLASAYEYSGELETALKHANRSIELHPAFAPAHKRKGIILGRQRHFVEAADEFETAVQLAPDDPDALTWLGESRVQLGQWAAAAESLEQATRLAPQNANAWLKLGVARVWLGEFDAARESLERAARMSPESARIARPMLDQLQQMRSPATPPAGATGRPR
jgi:Flp pilus assembly protein TadD